MFYGSGEVRYGPEGVDLSEFSSVTKNLLLSFKIEVMRYVMCCASFICSVCYASFSISLYFAMIFFY